MGNIIVFPMMRDDGDIDAIAVDGDGSFITAQVCSSFNWMCFDMDPTKNGFHAWFYNQRYPNGYTYKTDIVIPENFDGQREHTDESIAPWHLDPSNKSTWSPNCVHKDRPTNQ